MKQFPPLYKLTHTGTVQIHRIRVEGAKICTEYGHLNGAQQSTIDEIKHGKNLGKKNETSAEEQALLEAEAKWRKKIQREGYVEDLQRAKAGQTDAEGGIAPMLAQPLDVAKKHVGDVFDAQRKYNGLRCIVVVKDGNAGLWSRKRERILGVPHIESAYETIFEGQRGRYVFDGELYRHGWSLQTIGGYVRKKSEVKPGYEELVHHVYDFPSYAGPWHLRYQGLANLFNVIGDHPELQMVETFRVTGGLVDLKELHDQWVQDGYEGAIIRNLDGLYSPGKRSYDLIKMKEFDEAEYVIVGVTEGRGRMADKAVFICQTDAGKIFECVAPGGMEDKARFFANRFDLVGKPLTVKHFGFTDEGKPSHGVGVAVRDYE